MRQKLFRSLFGLGVLCILVTAALVSTMFYNLWKEDFQRSLVQETHIIAALAERGSLSADLLARISGETGNDLRFTWIMPNGQVVYDSNADAAQMENHLQRPEVQLALHQGHGSVMRDSATIHETNYYEALRLADGSIIRVARTGTSIYGIMMAAVPGVLILILCMCVICYFIARRTTAKMIAPVESAIQAWISGKQGDGAVNLYTEYEEIGPLIGLLDTQKTKIEESHQTIEEERNTLRLMMEAMNEAVILADSRGNILVHNQKVRDYFRFSEVNKLQGINLVGLSHDEEWLKHIAKAIENGAGSHYRREVDGRYYSVMIHPTGSDREMRRIFVMVADITSDYLAAKRRQEFTSNVSHELKTPLTTISGYAEILANGLYAKKTDVKELGGFIQRAAKDMLNLIESIMHLSKVEGESSELVFEQLPIRDLVMNSWSGLEGKRQGKNVSFAMTGDETAVYGNRELLQELFINLLDNAIKFSGNAENHISVQVHRQDKRAVITVSDTGIGIDPEKMERIFERFYQTDESRSSKREGSGIGLSLVKHILEIHHGTIRVDSERNKGSVFTITLPVEALTAAAVREGYRVG